MEAYYHYLAIQLILFFCVSETFAMYRLTEEELQKLLDICGKPKISEGEFKIYGGQRVNQTEHPWAVLVLTELEGREGLYSRCTGNIISRRHVLTAAHCFREMPFDEPAKVLVLAGSVCFACNPPREDHIPGDVYAVKSIVIPKSSKSLDGVWTGVEVNVSDIAIIELEESLPFSQNLRPICLPTYHRVPQSMVMYGFGQPEKVWFPTPLLNMSLWKFTVHADSRNCKCNTVMTCDLRYKTGWMCSAIVFVNISRSVQRQSACKGDSGGGAVAVHSGRYVLHGIASSASGRLCDDFLEYYKFSEHYFTRVSYHHDFICSQTGICPIRPGRCFAWPEEGLGVFDSAVDNTVYCTSFLLNPTTTTTVTPKSSENVLPFALLFRTLLVFQLSVFLMSR